MNMRVILFTWLAVAAMVSGAWAQGAEHRYVRELADPHSRNLTLIDDVGRPKPAQAKAITEIYRLYGKVVLAEQLSGRPVISVDFSRIESLTDVGLVHLAGLTHLQNLDLRQTNVTDAGLEHLKGLSQLRELRLGDTKVTEEGVKQLQKALPKCRIVREPTTADEPFSRPRSFVLPYPLPGAGEGS